jgi:hypothetical protein
MGEADSKFEHLCKFEGLTLSLEEARVLVEKDADIDYAMEKFVPLVGVDESVVIVNRMLDEDAKRACLISVYGLDRFCDAVTRIESRFVLNSYTDLLNSMELVSEELIKADR